MAHDDEEFRWKPAPKLARSLALTGREAQFSPGSGLAPAIEIPEYRDPVDWLVDSKSAYQGSALGKWDGRHSLDGLAQLAMLYSQFPDLSSSVIDYLFAAAGWACGEKLVPIMAGGKINRHASMIGGFPWTCKKYPWPQGKHGNMTPLVQLNLKTLSLGFIAKFPPVLLQVWGDGIYEMLREIPLADIENSTSDRWMPLRPHESHMGFESDIESHIGDYVEADIHSQRFTVPDLSDFFDEFEWDELHDEFGVARVSPEIYAAINQAVEDVTNTKICSYDWKGHNILRFGGQPSLYQISYNELTPGGWITLYQARKLSIFGDGALTIFFNSHHNNFKFMSYTDR